MDRVGSFLPFLGFPGLFSKHLHLLSHIAGPNSEVSHKHMKSDSERLAELDPREPVSTKCKY